MQISRQLHYMKCRGDPRGRPEEATAKKTVCPAQSNCCAKKVTRILRGICAVFLIITKKMIMKSLWGGNVSPPPPTRSPSISLPAPRRNAPRHDDAISSETPPCVTSCRDHLAAGEWPRLRHPTHLDNGQAG